jgi:hypothetical protein
MKNCRCARGRKRWRNFYGATCVRWSGNFPREAQIAIDSIDKELRRKEDAEREMGEQTRHGVIISGIQLLKSSVDQLAKPHWVLWATLIATAIAAVAGVILLFRQP